MKKTLLKAASGIAVLCILFAAFLYFNNDIGIPAGKLKGDILSSQKIVEGWMVDGSISDTMAAFISYPQDKADHTYSVYVNRPGLSFGYFFRGGGNIAHVEKYIAEFTLEGYGERAFVSMNAQKVARLEIDNGSGVRTIEIDSGKPFALVLSVNAGSICFYDVNGAAVEYLNHPL